MKLAGLFVIGFCFLFLLLVGLDHAQNTKGIEMPKNNLPVETFGFTRKTKQCTRSRFVHYKTKQLCSLFLTFVSLPNQLVLSITCLQTEPLMYKPKLKNVN